MKTQQLLWERPRGWTHFEGEDDIDAQLVLFFGSRETLSDPARFGEIRERFPQADLVGCTTAGEIIGEEVLDQSIVLTAIEFAATAIQVVSLTIMEAGSSREGGQKLGAKLPLQDLKTVLVISDGHQVNGSELVEGLTEALGSTVIITGGLAGDGSKFEKTLVGCNDHPEEGRIVAIGLYGNKIEVGHGSVGGWDTFGPRRMITRSEANVLYEVDGKPALQLYKKYLGDKANQLPGAALEFPLMIKPFGQPQEVGTVRTILAVDEKNQSMIFAGDMPEGHEAQLMMANFENLIDGAFEAAQYARLESFKENQGDSLAILISCVGRKMVLGQRIAEEVESVREILGNEMKQIGFYSYGEISPHVEVGNCQLHNQTMTITALREKL
jgi:hypothetical protein